MILSCQVGILCSEISRYYNICKQLHASKILTFLLLVVKLCAFTKIVETRIKNNQLHGLINL